jgi:hypothetical protein
MLPTFTLNDPRPRCPACGTVDPGKNRKCCGKLCTSCGHIFFFDGEKSTNLTEKDKAILRQPHVAEKWKKEQSRIVERMVG